MLLAIAAAALAPTILIDGGTVIDGTGSKRQLADVRVQGGRIIAMGQLDPVPTDTVIDAKGLIVAPGFIDAHSHAAGRIVQEPTALSQITQGITTAVVGQDGGWDKPFAEEMGEIQAANPAINFAAFSGHGGLRGKVMGEDYKKLATPAQVEQMKMLLDADMRAGALGLSSGLEYDPGYYSDTNELVALAKVAAKYGGLYISHVRDESDKAFDAFSELLTISNRAGIRAQISHIKLGTKAVWGKARLTDALLARKQITADVYPYLYWQSTIAALSPSRDWENDAIWVKALADVGGPQNVRLTKFTPDPSWQGQTLAELSAKTGKNAIDLIQEILARTKDGEGSQSVVVTAMTDADLDHFITNPDIMFCSDGSIGGSHPRGAGSFPRVLGVYVRERKLITLEQAIRRMTGLTARTFGLASRGILKVGQAADLVVFNAKTVKDLATPANSTALSVGIRDVVVNGVVTLRGGKLTGQRNGQVLLRG